MLTRRTGSSWEPTGQKEVIDLIQGNASELQWANQSIEIAIVHLLLTSMQSPVDPSTAQSEFSLQTHTV
jgi:ubiquinone/menaquinone biosynthesis C-methylase UbiE